MTATPTETLTRAQAEAAEAWARCLAAGPGTRPTITAHPDHTAAWVTVNALRTAATDSAT